MGHHYNSHSLVIDYWHLSIRVERLALNSKLERVLTLILNVTWNVDKAF